MCVLGGSACLCIDVFNAGKTVRHRKTALEKTNTTEISLLSIALVYLNIEHEIQSYSTNNRERSEDFSPCRLLLIRFYLLSRVILS